MSGQVFHPGHHDLHGITVVVETAGTLTYIGRFDSEDASGVHLLDVGVHNAVEGGSKDDYVRRCAKFGIRAEREHLIVPRLEVKRITRLGEIDA